MSRMTHAHPVTTTGGTLLDSHSLHARLNLAAVFHTGKTAGAALRRQILTQKNHGDILRQKTPQAHIRRRSMSMRCRSNFRSKLLLAHTITSLIVPAWTHSKSRERPFRLYWSPLQMSLNVTEFLVRRVLFTEGVDLSL